MGAIIDSFCLGPKPANLDEINQGQLGRNIAPCHPFRFSPTSPFPRPIVQLLFLVAFPHKSKATREDGIQLDPVGWLPVVPFHLSTE